MKTNTITMMTTIKLARRVGKVLAWFGFRGHAEAIFDLIEIARPYVSDNAAAAREAFLEEVRQENLAVAKEDEYYQ